MLKLAGTEEFSACPKIEYRDLACNLGTGALCV